MKGGTVYEQRDVILIPFPYSDLTGAKQRPALIISNGLINRAEDRICCLITSQKPEDGILMDSFETGSLPFKSWVKPHRIFTVDERIIKKKLCTITAGFHEKVLTKLNECLKLKS